MGDAGAPRAAPPQLSEVADLMRQVTAEFENGHLDAAIERCNALLSLDVPLPVASIFCQNRGNVYSAKGEPEKALRDYEQAIRFNPANAGAYLNRGLIYAQRNDHEAAIKDYNEALRFQPQMYMAFFNRALSYRAQEDWAAAERDLQETIRLNPKFAPAYVTRALISARRGRLDKALAEYELAKGTDPAVSEAHVGIGLLLLQKRAYARAAASFEKALELTGAKRELPLNSLAWLRATCPVKSIRDGKKAVEATLQACELTHRSNFACLDTLAAAYAENASSKRPPISSGSLSA